MKKIGLIMLLLAVFLISPLGAVNIDYEVFNFSGITTIDSVGVFTVSNVSGEVWAISPAPIPQRIEIVLMRQMELRPHMIEPRYTSGFAAFFLRESFRLTKILWGDSPVYSGIP